MLSIRVNESDLLKIKSRAKELGLTTTDLLILNATK
jgi:predicted DNA binding CopG/RHH family protein